MTAGAAAYLLADASNYIQADDAIRPDLEGMQIFDAPIFAVASADDPWFARLKEPSVVHPDYMLPTQWLSGANSVIAFFAPYTQRIREANKQDMREPADEWLHGRIEGEMAMKRLRLWIRDTLIRAGYASVAPSHDERMTMLAKYAPNWSERHTGHVCGLGTFGLSKGLITEKGVAGRLGSVVTSCALPATGRAYQGIYDYCNGCRRCAAQCPARAIDPERGMDHAKAHPPCDVFLSEIHSRPPKGKSGRQRYGCGKCQVGVPCEKAIPG